MASCSLNWYPDRGFELDLDAGDDEVTLRMVAVPIPADGTAVLFGPGVDLHRLEILFKGQAEIQGEPGQIQDAHVRLHSESSELEIEVRIEDMETGDLVRWSASVPVAVPRIAPDRGGPSPVPPDEDDLDWDDETTLERLIVDAPPASPTPEKKGPPKESRGTAGIQRLLKALETLDQDSDPGEAEERRPRRQTANGTRNTRGGESANAPRSIPPKAVPGVPSAVPAARASVPPTRPAPTPSGGLDSRSPAPASRAPGSTVGGPEARLPAGASATPSKAPAVDLGAIEEATKFLELLLEREALALEEDTSVADLAPGVARILAGPAGPERKARLLSGWLIDQPAVAELFLDDDELATLLEQW